MAYALERNQTYRRWLAVAVSVLLGAGLWSAASSHAATTAVGIDENGFNPAMVTVALGDTVTWTNDHGTTAHAPQDQQTGKFNSPDLQPGDSYSYTPTSLGDINYICRIHTFMSGMIHVVSGGGGTTTTTSHPSTTTTTPGSTTTTHPSTTTTSTPGSTTTTEPGGTTTTSTPGSTTTTTSRPSGGAGFQDVPNDPSADYPPGTPGSGGHPPSSAPQTTSTTSTTIPPGPGFQDVPNDPSADHTPGHAAASLKTASVKTASASDPSSPGTPMGDGTFLAPFTMDGDVKVFHLSMAPTTIEVSPGVVKDAYAFNGIVPGPTLRMNEGDKVRIIVDNHLPFGTSVHWHGMILPNNQDGVARITQPEIEPGERYTYEWTAIATGTHWYHSHTSGRHIGKGLYGALEVVPRTGDFKADRDYTVLIGDTDLGFVFNGRSFPSTATLITKVGETVHVRVIDTGDSLHAIHLHGVPFDVVAQDGNKITVPPKQDTLTIAPGQTYDLLFSQVNPGKWVFHCHIFAHSHMSGDTMPPGDTGMTGMVMIVNTSPAGSVLPVSPLATRSPIGSTHGIGAVASLWAPDLEHEIGVFLALVLALIALRTGGRRRPTPHTFPTRKEITQ